MDELLQKLFESDLLTAEMRTELLEAYQAQVTEAVAQAREEEAIKVRAELVEQWITDREQLVEAIDAKVEEYLEAEMKDLKEDISAFRDLEAEYAAKLVETRTQLAEELQNDMSTLIVQIDNFMEARLTHEMNELKEDLQIAKENQFGRKIMEMFRAEYVANFVDEDSVQAKLDETTDKLEQLTSKLDKVVNENAQLHREAVLNKLLAPLSGTKREVMETLLSNTATDKLSESYDKYIGRVLSENSKSEKENEVLSEANKNIERVDTKVVVKTGDTTDSAASTEGAVALGESVINELKRLSGQIV